MKLPKLSPEQILYIVEEFNNKIRQETKDKDARQLAYEKYCNHDIEKINDKYQRQQYNARIKYHTDPEYREKKLALNNNPKLAENRKISAKKAREKLNADPIRKEAKRQKQKAYYSDPIIKEILKQKRILRNKTQ
jgi:hypothetical protein